MGHKTKGATGKFAIFVGLGIGYIVLILSSSIFPYRSNQYLLFSVPVGIFSFLSVVWLTRKPNVYVKYFLLISISALLVLVPFRGMSYLFPQFSPYIETLIILGFILVNTLPIWNLPTATFISDELYAPKTLIGKMIFRWFLVIAPFATISGILLGKADGTKSGLSIFITGMLVLYLAFSIPFIGLSRYSAKDDRLYINDGLEGKEVSLPEKESSN